MAKFTIEQALESIKSKFKNAEGKTSLKISDRTIEESLAPLLELAGDLELAAFTDKAQKVVDTVNRNYIKDTTDFIKANPPAPTPTPTPAPTPTPTPTPTPAPAPGQFDMDAFFTRMAQVQEEAIVKATTPLQEQIQAMKGERELEMRQSSVSEKMKALKLSKSWEVDFSNGLKVASLELGSKATADELFAKANEYFNATLTAKGETYVPQSSEGRPSGSADFTGIKASLKAEKERKENELK